MVLRAFVKQPYSTPFVFDGGTGVGKTSAAIALAAELGCDVGEGEFGGVYQIASGEQTADAVRDVARWMGAIPFGGSGWKVVVLNEADRMHPQAEAVWLDVLERLPARTVVVFTTNSIGRMSQRFLDRCERVYFVSQAVALEPEARGFIERVWRRETGEEIDPAMAAWILEQSVVEGEVSFRRILQNIKRALAAG